MMWCGWRTSTAGPGPPPPKPASTETNLHLGRGCERSVRWLLRALSYAPTGARVRVLVAAFGSARPASQSASSARWIRADLSTVSTEALPAVEHMFLNTDTGTFEPAPSSPKHTV